MKFVYFIILFFALSCLFKMFNDKREYYIKTCPHKIGDIVYIKPDSSKAAISGYAISNRYYFGDTTGPREYEVINLSQQRIVISENLIYKKTDEENIY